MRCFEQRCANNGIVGVSIEARLPSALQPLVREVLQQLYADDQALVLPSLQGAEAAGAALHHVASEWGMSINYSKTKAMIIEADGHAGAAGLSGARPATIDLPGGSVEVVGAFKYIGALAACDGRVPHHRAAPPHLLGVARVAAASTRPPAVQRGGPVDEGPALPGLRPPGAHLLRA